MRSQCCERSFDSFFLARRLDPDVDEDGRLCGNDVVQGSCGRDGRGNSRAHVGSTKRCDIQYLV